MNFLTQILCGLLIGTTAGIISTPSENRKVRFQCGGDNIPSESSYPSNSPIVSALVVRLRRWFSGLSITIAKEITYWTSFIVMFFIIWHLQPNKSESRSSWIDSTNISGVVGAMLGGILSNPLDVLKARVQTVMATRRKIFDVGTASSETWDDPLAICECGANVIGNRSEESNSSDGNIESKTTLQITGNVSSVSNNSSSSPSGNSNLGLGNDDDKKEGKASHSNYWKRFGKNWWMIHGILPRILYMTLRYFVTRLWYCLILGEGAVP